MSSMYSMFETDKELEADGIWLDYGDFRVKVARSGGANKKYTRFVNAKYTANQRAFDTKTISEEAASNIFHQAFAEAVVLDWQIADGQNKDGTTKWKKGIHKKGGGVLEVTKDNLISVFRELPDLFADIQASANNISLFRKQQLEADAKN